MISKQVRKGIKIACINADTTVSAACKQSGVPKASIYRFMAGTNDIYMVKLDTLCRLGLNCTLTDVLEMGK
ncbi:MAG: hypothetical protein DRQ42_09265 [Gammaproteobacteria bacterium]|nr:MAG: hypothetical protein DRQ42_09265 [Gammaproteobacteria bacterium]